MRRTGLLFAVTHNYTGYPMVRQARQMIAGGELGAIRVVQVEYAQDWLATPLEKTGQKQAAWRTDPAQSGPAGSLGDIGTHAFNLACFVTGLNCRELAAELSTFVPGRRLDDHVQIMLRFAEGARGLLWASQVATGNQNNLRLRVYGEKGGLEWRQEDPNCLWFAPLGKTPTLIYRAGPGATAGGRARQPCAFGPSRGISRSLRPALRRHRRADQRPPGEAFPSVIFFTGAHGRRWRGRHALHLRRYCIFQPQFGLDCGRWQKLTDSPSSSCLADYCLVNISVSAYC